MSISYDEIYLSIMKSYPPSEIDAIDSIFNKIKTIFVKELKKEYKESKKGTSKCVVVVVPSVLLQSLLSSLLSYARKFFYFVGIMLSSLLSYARKFLYFVGILLSRC